MAMSNFSAELFDSVRRLARAAAHVPAAGVRAVRVAAAAARSYARRAIDALPRCRPHARAARCRRRRAAPRPCGAASRVRRPGDARAPRSRTRTRSTACCWRSSTAACSRTPTFWRALSPRASTSVPDVDRRGAARALAGNASAASTRRTRSRGGLARMLRHAARAAASTRVRDAPAQAVVPTAASACATCAARSSDCPCSRASASRSSTTC